MPVMHRREVAGRLVTEAVYPVALPRDGPELRAGKQKVSSEAKRRMNFKTGWRRLAALIAGNFEDGDLFVTLTYREECLPRRREEAHNDMKAFLKRLRASRLPRGEPVRYLLDMEHKHGEGRWHHHLILNGAGEDAAALTALWGKGFVEVRRLRIGDKRSGGKTCLTLARYLCKETPDKLGQHTYIPSLGLKKPERTAWREPDRAPPLRAPRGALVLENSGRVETVYGTYQYLSYLAKRG